MMNPQEIKTLLGEYRERRDRLNHAIRVMAPPLIRSVMVGTEAVPKVSMNKLAKRLGLSGTYVSNILNGKTVMSEDSFERLVDYHCQIGQTETATDGET